MIIERSTSWFLFSKIHISEYPAYFLLLPKFNFMKLSKPTLLLDKKKCLANISRMKAKADKYGLHFRPHSKTHQSAEVGKWLKDAGVSAITVSSVSMASYFARAGWTDITIAFPVNPAEIGQINRLAHHIRLNLLVENADVVETLGRRLTTPAGMFIKIDAGYHRTGIPVEAHREVLTLVQTINRFPLLQFKGLLAHNGHTYHAASVNEIKHIHDESLKKLSVLKSFLKQQHITTELSIGDTPSMSVTDNFTDVDEIRPGNFVFYDVMQAQLGSCGYGDIAVAMACPVVAKHAGRQELVIHGGAVHFSKDSVTGPDGNRIFGKVVTLNRNGWSEPVDGTYVKSLSQEHGIIRATEDFFNQTKPGDFIGVLPVHSCLTVNLMREYFTLTGEKITTAVT